MDKVINQEVTDNYAIYNSDCKVYHCANEKDKCPLHGNGTKRKWFI